MLKYKEKLVRKRWLFVRRALSCSIVEKIICMKNDLYFGELSLPKDIDIAREIKSIGESAGVSPVLNVE